MNDLSLQIITIGIDPEIHIGPVTVAWHGLTIALGVLAGLLIAGYVWRVGLSGTYMDAVALGLPLGVAVGRIGDVINGEHYGPQSDFFLAVRNSHPDAPTPNMNLAHQHGGLYKVLLGLLSFSLLWPLDRGQMMGVARTYSGLVRFRSRRPGLASSVVLRP